MYLLRISLQLLALLALIMKVLWLSVAIQDVCWQHIVKLRAVVVHCGIRFCRVVPFPRGVPHNNLFLPRTDSPVVLYRPANVAYQFVFGIVVQKLGELDIDEHLDFLPFQEAPHFAELVDSLVNDEPSPVVTRFRLGLEEEQRKKVQYLLTLPELITTPPDDGNRAPRTQSEEWKEVGVRGGVACTASEEEMRVIWEREEKRRA
ncbi:hypothetical protein GQ44DRAFT_722486 [Phaeosphaeriaceae sp. PMI808]|nr:hypothetical protein GQ44DRAFT_722486 [Phaeosphaeriaceae sp. PMI808]